jgi:hypothetical protein
LTGKKNTTTDHNPPIMLDHSQNDKMASSPSPEQLAEIEQQGSLIKTLKAGPGTDADELKSAVEKLKALKAAAGIVELSKAEKKKAAKLAKHQGAAQADQNKNAANAAKMEAKKAEKAAKKAAYKASKAESYTLSTAAPEKRGAPVVKPAEAENDLKPFIDLASTILSGPSLSAENVAYLNSHLQMRSFICRYECTSADTALYEALKGTR